MRRTVRTQREAPASRDARRKIGVTEGWTQERERLELLLAKTPPHPMENTNPPSNGKSFTRFFPTIARILMGLVFFVFGLDGFLHFIPHPTTPMPEGVSALMAALIKSGYLFQLIKGTEVVVGVLFLANRFVPLALALIAPVVVNILAFSMFLMPAGIAVPLVVTALELYLAWSYRSAFRAMLGARVTPG